MSDTPHQLLIQSGTQAGRAFALESDSITIGRYPLADIVINDPDMAYRHALLTRGEVSYRIADLGSDSGTYVNGRRIGSNPIALAHGDLILFGSSLSAAYLEHAIEPVPDEESASPPILEAVPDAPDDSLVVTAVNTDLEESNDLLRSEYEPPVIERREATAGQFTADDQATEEPHHPGPLPAMPPPQKNKNGRIIMITAGCLALLACCCSSTLFMYFIGGDWLLRQLGYLP